MRSKDEILKEVGSLAKENPRGGIIPDLADVLLIEVLIDIRDLGRAFYDRLMDFIQASD
jgi:hypothetical protein